MANGTETTPIQWTHLPDPHLHVTMEVPVGWQYVQRPSPPMLAQAQNARYPGMVVAVSGYNVQRDIAPADWLKIILLARHGEIIEEETAPGPGGASLSIIVCHWVGDEGLPAISLCTSIQDGAVMFMFEARCVEPHAEELLDVFEIMLASFRLLNPLGRAEARPFQQITLSRPASASVLLAGDWSVAVDAGEGDRTSTATARLGSPPQSVLHIALLPPERPGPGDIAQDLLRRAMRSGLQLHRDETLELDEIEPGTWTGSLNGQDPRGGPLMVLVGVVRRPAAWGVMLLVGLPPQVDPMAAAADERSLEIAFGGLRAM